VIAASTRHDGARTRAHARIGGRRLFVERPCLLDHLRDRDALARLPEGSLGRAYLAHIERYGLDPGKLVALGRSYEREISTDDEGVRWYADRSELSHDLAHVLTGYGADGLGETALIWFSYGLRGRGNALLMIGAAFAPGAGGPGWRSDCCARIGADERGLPLGASVRALARGAPRRGAAARARLAAPGVSLGQGELAGGGERRLQPGDGPAQSRHVDDVAVDALGHGAAALHQERL
jgi:hypothetical protein